MSALTWRAVSSPDFTGSATMLKTMAEQLDKATSGLSTGLKDWQGARMSRAEDQIAQQASQYDSPEAYRAALASGQILSGVDQGLIGRRLIEAAAGQESVIAAREKQGAQYAMPEIDGLIQQAMLNKDDAAVSALVQQYGKQLRLTNSPYADPFKVQSLQEGVKNTDAKRAAPYIDNAVALAISQGAYGNAQALSNNNQELLQRAGSQNFSPLTVQSNVDKHALSTLATAVADVTLPADKRKLIDSWLAEATPTQRQAFFAQNPEYNSAAALLASATPGIGDATDADGNLIKSGTGIVPSNTAPATATISSATKPGTGIRVTADTLSDSKGKTIPASIAAIAHEIGLSGAELKIHASITGQESGDNAKIGNSIDGARGPGQVMPDTFKRYALPGESIDNPADNIRVSQRIIKDLSKKTGGDPARIAVGYFSGEGNIAPAGSPTPWKRDTQDGNKKRVSSYVADVVKRHSADKNTYTPAPLIPTKQEIADSGIIAAGTGDNKASQILANNPFNEVKDIGSNDIAGAHKFLVSQLGEGGADIISPVRFRELHKQFGRVETQASIEARKNNPKLAPVTELVPAGEFAVSLLDATSNTGGFFGHTQSMSGDFKDAILGNFSSKSKWIDLPTLKDNVRRSGSAIPEIMNRNAAVAKASAQDVKDMEDAVAKQRSQVAVYKTLLEARSNDPKLKAAYEASVLRLNEMLVATKERNTGTAAKNSQ